MFGWPIKRKPRPTTCSEAGKLGALARQSAWEAKRNATVAKLCAEMGRPVPEVFR